MRKKHLFIFLSAICVNVFATLEGCTGLQLTAGDGSSIRGRTLEFGVDVKPSVAVIPKNYEFSSTTTLGTGMSYQAKYAAVGTMCYDQVLLMDGMNEMGLSVGTFYFPGFAVYSSTSAENRGQSLSPVDFPNWIVTQFATLDEVRKALADVKISPVVIKEWGNEPPPFHYIVYDRTGNSIVIEPLKGELVVYDNPLGVLTNSPTFDWHMTNLRNYIGITPENLVPLEIKELSLSSFGMGSGMFGLPGDFTPPSRFVRSTFFSLSAAPASNAEGTVARVFHLLNQFDIPFGSVRMKEGGKTVMDYTLLTAVHDPVNLRYFFRTYDDQNISFVDLKSFDKAALQPKKWFLSGEQEYLDVSSRLQ